MAFLEGIEDGDAGLSDEKGSNGEYEEEEGSVPNVFHGGVGVGSAHINIVAVCTRTHACWGRGVGGGGTFAVDAN